MTNKLKGLSGRTTKKLFFFGFPVPWLPKSLTDQVPYTDFLSVECLSIFFNGPGSNF